jgi:hypothetical protein
VPVLRPADEGAKVSISKALRRNSVSTLGLQMKVKKCQIKDAETNKCQYLGPADEGVKVSNQRC